MSDLPTHRHKPTGQIVFPAGYPSAELELLPTTYWRDREMTEAWAALRAERDHRLAASDWTQMRDQDPLLSAKWQPYRRALKDMPAQTRDPHNPHWPEKPA
jgi:hypothetical protein